MEIPCIFEVDPNTKEATGTVAPFCSEGCRYKAGGERYPGFKVASIGVSRLSDFGYEPHCEDCGSEITEIKTHGWVVNPSSNLRPKDVMQFGFHLEGDVLFPDGMDVICRLLGSRFIVIDVTDPKTESSRGLPPRVVRVDRLLIDPTSI